MPPVPTTGKGSQSHSDPAFETSNKVHTATPPVNTIEPLPASAPHVEISIETARAPSEPDTSLKYTITALEALIIPNDANSSTPSPISTSTPTASTPTGLQPTRSPSLTPSADPPLSAPTTTTSSPESKNQRLPVQKAVLIGINYKVREGVSSHIEVLKGPHRDVMAMKKILIEQYGYDDHKIVIMIDGTGYLKEQTPDNIDREQINQPTRDNILRELDNLVRDAQPGDHFLFHYAGHSEQQPTQYNGEEDGLDEMIITSDSEEIVDKVLKEKLVDSLPPGTSLIAIFDTCHSGTLLDLKHHRCNRVYTPWVNRNQTQSVPQKSLTIYSEKRDLVQGSAIKPRTRRTEVYVKGSSKGMSVQTRSSSSSSIYYQGQAAFEDLEIPRCESPRTTLHCAGDCRESPSSGSTDSEKPYVVSMAACKDSQICWENPSGESMTQALIKILTKDPHPSMSDLLTEISHSLYQASLELHKFLADKAREGVASGPSDFKEHFQDPQFASHKPLDMSAPFTLGTPRSLKSGARA